MARWSDIGEAFVQAKKRDSKGRARVSVRDFITELTKRNHHFSPAQAVEYINQYQSTWRILEEGEHGLHVYQQYAKGLVPGG